MPQFVYTGSSERFFLYPRAFAVSPDDVIEADDNPDPHWFAPVVKPSPSPRAEKKST